MIKGCSFCVGHGVTEAGKDAKAFIKHGSLNIEINEEALCVDVEDFDEDGDEIHFKVEAEVDEILIPIKFCPMCGEGLSL